MNYYYDFFHNNEACTHCGLCHLKSTEKKKAGESGLKIPEIAKALKIDVAAQASELGAQEKVETQSVQIWGQKRRLEQN